MGDYGPCPIVSQKERELRFRQPPDSVADVLSRYRRFFGQFGYDLRPYATKKAITRRFVTKKTHPTPDATHLRPLKLSLRQFLIGRVFAEEVTANKRQQTIYRYAIASWLIKLKSGANIGKIIPDLRQIEEGLRLALEHEKSAHRTAARRNIVADGRISLTQFQCVRREKEFARQCYDLVSELQNQIERTIRRYFGEDIRFLTSIGVKQETAEDILTGLNIRWNRVSLVQMEYTVQKWDTTHTVFFDRIKSTRFNWLKWRLTYSYVDYCTLTEDDEIPVNIQPRDFSVWTNGRIVDNVEINFWTEESGRVHAERQKCLSVDTLQKYRGRGGWYREFPPIDSELLLLIKRLEVAKRDGVDYVFISVRRIAKWYYQSPGIPRLEKEFREMLLRLGFTRCREVKRDKKNENGKPRGPYLATYWYNGVIDSVAPIGVEFYVLKL